MHSHTQTYTVSEMALAQRQQAAKRKHKSTVLRTLQEQLNLLANTDLLLERVLETLTQVFTFDALVEHVYADECKAYVMRDKRYIELDANFDACQRNLAQLEKKHAQLENECMRLQADLASCQKQLSDSEQIRADLQQARRQAPDSLCSFSDSESSFDCEADWNSSDDEDHV